MKWKTILKSSQCGGGTLLSALLPTRESVHFLASLKSPNSKTMSGLDSMLYILNMEIINAFSTCKVK